MARPLSEDKRNAILTAATQAVAELGMGASTARIARDAGVAEGSLFTYFNSKDELLNQLYLSLKADFRAVMIDGYNTNASVRDRCRHIWDRSVDWGQQSPVRRKALRQLTVSEKLTEQTRTSGAEAFRDMQSMWEEGLKAGVLRQLPNAFIGNVLESIAETVLESIARDPGHAETYRQSGFDAFWGAISSK